MVRTIYHQTLLIGARKQEIKGAHIHAMWSSLSRCDFCRADGARGPPHREAAKDFTAGKSYYIPHRAVIKNDSATTKTRIVYDGSSKQRGCLSLNECAFAGPSILQSIVGILLRARTRKFLVTADVEKAFHMVSLQEQCRDLTRFLWLKDINKPPTSNNIITLRFARVPFGLTSSPFLLAMAITWYLERNPHQINEADMSLQAGPAGLSPKGPNSAKTTCLNEEIRKNLYVDNVIMTCDDEVELMDLYQNSKSTFDGMKMNLREYQTNHQPTSELIPEKDRAVAGPVKLLLLGLKWDPITDQISIKIPLCDFEHPSKRQLVAFSASRFDPLGIIAPAMTRIKSLIQDVWKENCAWDEKIPIDLLPEWRIIVETDVEREFVLPRSNKSQRYSKGTPTVGQVVLITDKTPRHTWNMGLIVELETSKDGEIRSAQVKTQTGIFRRSINQLIPLEVSTKDPENLVKKSPVPRIQPSRACKEGVSC
ncbi:unnamed protein product [Caenorhabditis angaria]|uniref:DUF5641 domain-containing protein n=1 Tax=Caenorhabditis angaria TaxID=860376 RepID=A0A9P1N0C1_9PELO|nr:unnamed protein product [Caenorhabditis angaria]